MSTDDKFSCMEIWGGNKPIDKDFQTPGLEFSIFSQPCDNAKAGGDVIYTSQCASGRITRIVLADVSGHGQLVSETASDLRDLMRKYINYIKQSKFVESMNHKFNVLQTNEHFATAVVMTYFQPTRILQLSNAGHPPPLYYSSTTGLWSFIYQPSDNQEAMTDIPLGILPSTCYSSGQFKLSVGDVILTYSDALIECPFHDGTLLGTDGLFNLTAKLDISQDSNSIIHALMDRINESTGSQLSNGDDTTITALKVNETKVSLLDNVLAPVRFLRPVKDSTSLQFES
jgi:sigma-B regulation protein RsbU (phosphoserine phosphatase)